MTVAPLTLSVVTIKSVNTIDPPTFGDVIIVVPAEDLDTALKLPLVAAPGRILKNGKINYWSSVWQARC